MGEGERRERERGEKEGEREGEEKGKKQVRKRNGGGAVYLDCLYFLLFPLKVLSHGLCACGPCNTSC